MTVEPREFLERVLAGVFGRQPDMSGDQRKRLNSRERHAVEDVAARILAALASHSAEHLIALCGCNHEPCSCVGLDGRPLASDQPLGFRTSDVPDPYNSPPPAPASHDDVAYALHDQLRGIAPVFEKRRIEAIAAALRRAVGEVMDERERLAKMIEEYAMEQPPGGLRTVLVIAAKDVRRGRRLIDKERLTNLKNAMDEVDAEEAAAAQARAK